MYQTAVGGAHVLRSVKAGKVWDERADEDEDRMVVFEYLWWACRAGLDLPVIRGLAEKSLEVDINLAAELGAAQGGHTDVLDLLANEFGAEIEVHCLIDAARWSLDAMIDHLVEEYGVDPNDADHGCTALHEAAEHGRVRTVKHLVEKHNVDIYQRSRDGWTALELAEEKGMTECAAYLRSLQSTRPPAS